MKVNALYRIFKIDMNIKNTPRYRELISSISYYNIMQLSMDLIES